MGISAAGRYIRELHKRQENPYLWPDFLTGLPDKTAIIKKLDGIFPYLGKYSLAFVKIANIHPYIVKYGPDKHADIIQWAAAVLQTTCDKYGGCFVGTLSTHNFIVICETKCMMDYIKEAGKIFNKKMESYYSKEDLQSRTTLSFRSDGKKVRVGLMRFVSVIVDRRPKIAKSELILVMEQICEELSKTGEKTIVMGKEYVSDNK